MSSAERLRPTSVVDQAYEALRSRILTGDFAPGERFRQETLARQLGISRTPLREALRLLAADGLVTFETNHGARVTPIDPAEEREAWAARLVLEPAAARAGAELGTAEAIGAVREAVALQAAAGGDVAAQFEANRRFHLALVAAAGNRHLSRLAELLWARRIGMGIFGRQAADGGRAAVWADEHAEIAGALEAGDAPAAEALTRAHIARYPPPGP